MNVPPVLSPPVALVLRPDLHCGQRLTGSTPSAIPVIEAEVVEDQSRHRLFAVPQFEGPQPPRLHARPRIEPPLFLYGPTAELHPAFAQLSGALLHAVV